MKLHYSSRAAKHYRNGAFVWFRSVNHGGAVRKMRPFGDITVRDHWWCYATKRWVTSECPLPDGGSSHYSRCDNYRKFRRLIKKWSKYLPKGTEVRIVGRFDMDITGRTV